jgi:diadenosine tetraphosphate (Ap4A) HIT family hydrolase
MKNCIVLSGHYRNFDQTGDDIKQFIEINDMDVYCHLWSDELERETSRQVNNITKKLKPVSILVEEPKDFSDIETYVRKINPKEHNTDRIAGTLSMQYARKKALHLIDRDYDVLVYTRYDIGFKQLFKFQNVDCLITPEEESYNIISDIFAMMPMELTKYFFLYDEVERLFSTQFEPEFENWLRNIKNYGERNTNIHMHERYCPHMMMLRHLYNNEVKQVTANIPVFIQR